MKIENIEIWKHDKPQNWKMKNWKILIASITGFMVADWFLVVFFCHLFYKRLDVANADQNGAKRNQDAKEIRKPIIWFYYVC